MPIITYPLNGIEYTAADAETYLCTRSSGVYAGEDCYAARVTGSREVTISRGLAWIHNSYFSGKSVANTEDVAIKIPIADTALNRIDRIVLRFSATENASSIILKSGMPSSNPVAPALERTALVYELGLCDISVPAGSISVSAQNLKSTLRDKELCGIMSDGVTVESDDYVLITDKGKPLGVASLDANGKVPTAQLPAMAYIPTSQKGAANGVASLNANKEVPLAQLPVSVPNGLVQLNEKSRIDSYYLPDGIEIWETATITSGASFSTSPYKKYTGTNISNLRMTVSSAPAYGSITFGTSKPTISVTTGSSVLVSGDDIKTANAGEVWEFSVGAVGNKVAIIWKNWSA